MTVPYVVAFIVMNVCGFVSDLVLKRGWLSTVNSRRVFMGIGKSTFVHIQLTPVPMFSRDRPFGFPHRSGLCREGTDCPRRSLPLRRNWTSERTVQWSRCLVH